jgi:guanine deaminase
MSKSSTHIVIRGGMLLNAADHATIPADILVKDDTIHEIAAPGMAAPDDAREVDAGGKLLIPGLVNGHTHGHGSLSKGVADRWTLELLINAGSWTSANFTVEDKYLATMVNAAEMVRKGCTAAYDLYLEIPLPSREGMEAVARAYADVGIRAVVAPMMTDHLLYTAVPGLLDAFPDAMRRRVAKLRAEPFEAAIAICREFLDQWSFDRSMVRPALAPSVPFYCSDAFLIACRDLAKDHDIGIQMHLGESKVEAVSGIRKYGKTLTAHIDSLDMLGPDFTAAHCVWVDDEDLQRIADRGAAIAHNPGSNMRLGCGVAPVRAMMDKKIRVAIGTDGSASSDNQNMFEAMRLASFASRIQSPDYATWLTTGEVLELATVGGADVLGFGDAIGRIAPGYKADIVFLDLTNINYVPLNDATNQIVNSEDSSAVDSVMIGGRMVLENGRFTTLNYEKMLRDVETTTDRLRAVNADAKEFAQKIEDVVGMYCVGLAQSPYHVHRFCGHHPN